MATSSALAVASQAHKDAELLQAHVLGLENYLEATADYGSWGGFIRSDRAMFKAMAASAAYRWFASLDAPSSVTDDVLRAVAEAVEQRPWVEKGLEMAPAKRDPELDALLRPHVDAIVGYINDCTDHDSFEEFAAADPSGKNKAMNAVRSIRWVLDADLDDLTREQIFMGPAQSIEEYPWIGDGLQWAARRIAAA